MVMVRMLFGSPEAEISRRPLALDPAKCREHMDIMHGLPPFPSLELHFGWHPEKFTSRSHSSHILWELKSSTTRNQNEFKARTRTIKPLSYRSRSGIPSRKASRSPRQQTLGSAGF
jgi:hypothetical protein